MRNLILYIKIIPFIQHIEVDIVWNLYIKLSELRIYSKNENWERRVWIINILE